MNSFIQNITVKILLKHKSYFGLLLQCLGCFFCWSLTKILVNYRKNRGKNVLRN